MKARILTRSLLTTAAVIGFAAALTLTAPSDGRADIHQWKSASGVGYHWKRVDVDPLVLKVRSYHDVFNDGTNIADWPAIFQLVITDWSQSDANPPGNGSYGGTHLDLNVVNKGKANIESYNGYYGNNGWLGLASISLRDFVGHIRSGVAYVNEFYISDAFYADGTPYTGFDEEEEQHQVMCQEIGHDFGLDHIDSLDTCMAGHPLGGPRATPNDADAAMLTGMMHNDGDGGGTTEGGPKVCNKNGKPPGCVQPAASQGYAVWAEQYETEAELFDAADLVVAARVLNGSSFDRAVGRPDRALPVSRVVLRVSDWVKGDSRPVIVLEQTRGPGLELVDDRGYVAGDDYLLYLREIDANTYRTVNPDGRILQ